MMIIQFPKYVFGKKLVNHFIDSRFLSYYKITVSALHNLLGLTAEYKQD